MRVLKILENNINDRFIDIAVKALADGEIIIYPTDTLYAIGCNARIYLIKLLNPDYLLKLLKLRHR